jgi:hypothetical protein
MSNSDPNEVYARIMSAAIVSYSELHNIQLDNWTFMKVPKSGSHAPWPMVQLGQRVIVMMPSPPSNGHLADVACVIAVMNTGIKCEHCNVWNTCAHSRRLLARLDQLKAETPPPASQANTSPKPAPVEWVWQ